MGRRSKRHKEEEEEVKRGQGGKNLARSRNLPKKQAKRRIRPEAIALRPAESKTYAEILCGIRSKFVPKKSGTENKGRSQNWEWGRPY